MERVSLLKAFDCPKEPDKEEVQLEHCEPKNSNMYFDPCARRKIKLETEVGENDLFKKKCKILSMFDPLDDHLKRNGGLRLDPSFIKKVTELSITTIQTLIKEPWKLSSLFGDSSPGHRKVGTKYVFLAALHLSLKERSLHSEGLFIFEISMSTLLKCYSHLSVCQSTLAKYLTVVRLICNQIGQDLGTTQDKKAFFLMLSTKMIGVLFSSSIFKGLLREPEKIETKLKTYLNRFCILQGDLDRHLSVRPISHHAFAVVYLCLTIFVNRLQLPHMTQIVAILKSSDSHFSSLEYSSCAGCAMNWKFKTIEIFRKAVFICSGDAFFWSWKNYYQRKDKRVVSDNILDDNLFLNLKPTENDHQSETTFENSKVRDADENLLGKREKRSSCTGQDQTTDHSMKDVESHTLDSDESEGFKTLLYPEEREYLHVILKSLLKSSTLKLLGFDLKINKFDSS